MPAPDAPDAADRARRSLRTPTGEVPLHDYRLRLGGREWGVLHTGAVLTEWDEQHVLSYRDRVPYGVALWPSAIALAHDVVLRADAFRGRRVLELGAGTGLPGIVAASLGARVVQTDRSELALDVCRRNGERNGAGSGAIEYRLADWAAWADGARYDWILGADVIYGETAHPHLRRILASNLAPGGRVLLADPFRATGLRLLTALEGDGWSVALAKWNVGEERAPRPVGVYELAPPGAGGRR